MNDSLRHENLFKVVELYFKKYYHGSYEKNVTLKGSKGKWRLDFIVTTPDGDRFGVVVKDWIRTLGVNQVRQLQKICLDTSLNGGVLITNSLSPSAISFGKRFGVSCYTKWQILSKL
ncbi:MAG: restriction endonuclease [Promethearchaeota archaeon]